MVCKSQRRLIRPSCISSALLFALRWIQELTLHRHFFHFLLELLLDGGQRPPHSSQTCVRVDQEFRAGLDRRRGTQSWKPLIKQTNQLSGAWPHIFPLFQVLTELLEVFTKRQYLALVNLKTLMGGVSLSCCFT